ncbi:hypothetical protein ACK3TF_004112 [Chlorella vulgaris]
MQRSLSGSGKKRRAMGAPSGGKTGSGTPAAAGDSLASQSEATPPHWIEPEQQAADDATEPGSNDDSPEGGGEAAAAADTALADLMPALYELLTRLLILDRSIRSSWR